MTENVIVRPSYDHMKQNEIPNLYCKAARNIKSYPRVSIVYCWKCSCSSSDKSYRKKETSFFSSHWPFGTTWKFRNFIAYLQDLPYYILEHYFSPPELKTEYQWQQLHPNRHFLVLNSPQGKKTQNLIAHMQNMLNQIVEYNNFYWTVIIFG